MKASFRLLAAAAVVLAAACGSVPMKSDREIRVVGSDTMLELNRRLAEGYMRANPGDAVRVEGGGSGTGIKALLDGTAEVAAASRPLAPSEVAALYDRFGTLGVRFLIAQDALSLFVNAANPIRNLGLEQLREIFSGTVVTWSEISGREDPVTVVVRPPSSGSHRFFRDHVLQGAPYDPAARAVPTTRAVLEAVSRDAAAIGYGGIAYGRDGVVQVAVDGIVPTADNVRRGLYPLSRYLAFYTSAPPSGLARRFIEWCLSAEGQSIVAEVGYVPLWPSSL